MHFKKIGLTFLFSYLFTSIIIAQNFSILTDETKANCGCIQLENPPIGDAKPYPNQALQVFLFPENPDIPSPPIIGNWKRATNQLFFCPLIPFTKSLTYQARFPELPYFTFKPQPKKDYTPTTVVNIFPNSKIIPENTLKIYLYFSASMNEGKAYEYLNLVDEKGTIVEQPFLELYPILWNEERTRLTLWFDPGRVKRDLIKNRKLGAPLKAGHAYTLKINRSWKDANGYSLAKDFEHSFEVEKADRVAPTTKFWMAISPKANTKEPLIIQFGESLDHALAAKSLTVYNKKGKVIKGTVSLKKEDTEWEFVPLNNWQPNLYRIQIKGELEDLAGNNFNRLFDVDLTKAKVPTKKLPYYYFDFEVTR